MTRAARQLAPIVAITALVLGPQIAWAGANPCGGSDEGGMGGTGLGDERGMGGTGLGDERGMGGTGAVAQGGAGGTGFYGTVTGFGSICVNGQPVRFDASTRVERDGAPNAVTNLRAGQTVLVDAVREGDGYRAAKVDVQAAVTGTVTRVDSADQRVEVLLQVVDAPRSVQRSSGLSLAEVRPGDRIAVHGLRDADGNIRATRIEPARADAPASVTGRVRVLPDGGNAIGRLRVGTDVASAAPEAPVRVTGRWDAGGNQLAEARSRPALDFAPGTRQASLEAWVAGREGSRLATPLGPIATDRAVAIPDRPDVGSRVWAIGAFTPEGGLDARLIEVDAIGGGAPTPPERDEEVTARGGDADDADDVDDADDSDDVDDVDDSDDVDDVGDVDDADDVGDVDDAEDMGDVDDVGDVDDGGGPDIDEGDLPDIDEGDIPDFDEGDIPDFDEGDIPDFDEGDIPDFDDGDIPDIDDAAEA